MSPAKVSRPPARAALIKVVAAALDEMKAVNVKILDVREATDVADCMVLASGNSDRHVRSISDRVVERAKAAGFRPLGVEGQRDAEWVLVDLNDVIVHVMLPRVREFYALETLWDVAPAMRVKATSKVKAKAKTKTKTKAPPRAKAKSASRSANSGAPPARRAGKAVSGRSRTRTRS